MIRQVNMEYKRRNLTHIHINMEASIYNCLLFDYEQAEDMKELILATTALANNNTFEESPPKMFTLLGCVNLVTDELQPARP